MGGVRWRVALALNLVWRVACALVSCPVRSRAVLAAHGNHLCHEGSQRALLAVGIVPPKCGFLIWSVKPQFSDRRRVNLRKHTRAGGHIHTTGGHRGHTRRATCPRSHHAAGPADLREAECECADGVERAACSIDLVDKPTDRNRINTHPRSQVQA